MNDRSDVGVITSVTFFRCNNISKYILLLKKGRAFSLVEGIINMDYYGAWDLKIFN